MCCERAFTRDVIRLLEYVINEDEVMSKQISDTVREVRRVLDL
jgi:hypothetical protein